jgi:hypothetical protein
MITIESLEQEERKDSKRVRKRAKFFLKVVPDFRAVFLERMLEGLSRAEDI